MIASITALVVAVVGVLGTLTAQFLASRDRRQDSTENRRERADVREADERRANFLDRRRSYANLHIAAWNFRRALKTAAWDAGPLADLEEARQAFVTAYRNNQLICTDEVLRAGVPAYNELTDAYGEVRKPPGRAGESFRRDSIINTLNTTTEDAIRNLRRAMRADLGVSEPDDLPEHG